MNAAVEWLEILSSTSSQKLENSFIIFTERIWNPPLHNPKSDWQGSKACAEFIDTYYDSPY